MEAAVPTVTLPSSLLYVVAPPCWSTSTPDAAPKREPAPRMRNQPTSARITIPPIMYHILFEPDAEGVFPSGIYMLVVMDNTHSVPLPFMRRNSASPPPYFTRLNHTCCCPAAYGATW